MPETELLDADRPGIERAARLLDAGEVVAVPTETVYGLAGLIARPEAISSIYAAKGRPATNPLIVHVDRAMAHVYSERMVPAAAVLADALWPGPLTIVVPRSDAVSDAVTGGLDTVALRSPDHPVCTALLALLGSAFAAPSANRYGHVSPTTAEHVLDDLDGRIAAVVDGGPCAVGVESTIVYPRIDRIDLLRTGGIPTHDIAEISGLPVIDVTGGRAIAPGMAASHYAPSAEVRVVTADEVRSSLPLPPSTLVVARTDLGHPHQVILRGDSRAFAAGLYAALRGGDDPDVDTVLVVPPEAGDLSDAIADRLRRAGS